MSKISVVVNVVKEEIELLPKALASVKKLADEIVIVDMTEGDGEFKKIARKFKAKVYKHKRIAYVEPARQFGIGKAKGKWVLVMDPDEQIRSGLGKKLMKMAKDKKAANYYRLPRKNIIFGKWIKHSRWWPDYNIRFFQKGNVSWSEVIHSVPITTGRGADLEASERNAIVHYHYNTVEQFVERMNRYTSQQAKNLVKGGYKFDWKDLIKKPTAEFLGRYFMGEGYKEGVHGLGLAGLQAMSELVLYMKVFQMKKFKKQKLEIGQVVGEIKKNQSELNYWVADTMIKEGYGTMLERMRRKFKLQ